MASRLLALAKLEEQQVKILDEKGEEWAVLGGLWAQSEHQRLAKARTLTGDILVPSTRKGSSWRICSHQLKLAEKRECIICVF